MKTLILTDNDVALRIARELASIYGGIDIGQSPGGNLADLPVVNVQAQIEQIVDKNDLVVSLHCNQIFPLELVRKVRCINVHPGYNPFNRGCFPQVFSIMNGLKAGVTIHEIDEQIDHGPIIVQRECAIRSWDTSESAYRNIMAMERELLLEHFPSILDRIYSVQIPDEGNLNLKTDFERVRKLDLNRYGAFGDFLNQLRALTHGPYKNAYFIDKDGKRIFVRVMLELADSSAAEHDDRRSPEEL